MIVLIFGYSRHSVPLAPTPFIITPTDEISRIRKSVLPPPDFNSVFA